MSNEFDLDQDFDFDDDFTDELADFDDFGEDNADDILMRTAVLKKNNIEVEKTLQPAFAGTRPAPSVN